MFNVTKTTQCGYTAYVLSDTNANTSVTVVPEKGGMVTSFTKEGKEFLWLREPNFSLPERPRCAVPVLFPACGRAPEGGYNFNGKNYDMEIHGIVHSVPWEVVGTDTADGAAITLKVTSNEISKQSYPFDFCLTFTYVLDGTALSFLQSYENTGDVDMPFNFGFHPYFAISSVDNLTFSLNAETLVCPVSGEDINAPEEVDFPYCDTETTRIYKNVQSPMAFTDTKLERTIAVYFDDNFKNAVLWSQCDLGFICLEPWNGIAGSLATQNHEILSPNCVLDAEMAIVIL